MKRLMVFAVALMLALPVAGHATTTWVKPHHAKNGTYVGGHYTNAKAHHGIHKHKKHKKKH